METIYVGAGLVALGIIAAVVALAWNSGGPTGVAKSLMLIEAPVGQRSVTKNELAAKDRLVMPIFDQTRALAMRLSPSGTSERLSTLLDRAGNPAPWTFERLMGAKGAAMIVGVVLGFVYGDYSITGLVYGVLGGIAFFFLPEALIYNVALKRQEKTSKGLADALDMLTVCVEAGQGFDAALDAGVPQHRGADRRRVRPSPLGDPARQVARRVVRRARVTASRPAEVRTSRPLWCRRTDWACRSPRCSASSPWLPAARRQKAEERPRRSRSRSSSRCMVCIFPALFVVVIGPGAINMMGMFDGMTGG